jgi:hypothetical protein
MALLGVDKVSGSGTGIVTPYNTHRGIDFDGAADRKFRNADLVGNADGQQGILSFWYRLDAGDGVAQTVLWNAQFTVQANRDANNNWLIQMANAAGAGRMQVTATGGLYVADPTTWHHIAVSWDLSVPVTTGLWLDGAVPAGNPNVAINDTID